MKRYLIQILLLILALLLVLVGGSDAPPADRCVEVCPCQATRSAVSWKARVMDVAVPIVVDGANRLLSAFFAEDE